MHWDIGKELSASRCHEIIVKISHAGNMHRNEYNYLNWKLQVLWRAKTSNTIFLKIRADVKNFDRICCHNCNFYAKSTKWTLGRPNNIPGPSVQVLLQDQEVVPRPLTVLGASALRCAGPSPGTGETGLWGPQDPWWRAGLPAGMTQTCGTHTDARTHCYSNITALHFTVS